MGKKWWHRADPSSRDLDAKALKGAALEGAELSPGQIEKVRHALVEELRSRPPTIGVVGISGVGKSSTLNTLFKTRLPISDTVACTKEFYDIEVGVRSSEGRTAGMEVPLRIVDAPGLGEDISRDASYLEEYERRLPECDVVLWITAARNRAASLDQMYLQALAPFQSKMVFAVNQVDLIEPMDWDESVNLPSVEQEEKMNEILEDRRQRLEGAVGRPIVIEAYSAKKHYRLPNLFASVLHAIPVERTWIYAELKGFHYDDFVPEHLRARLESAEDRAEQEEAEARRGQQSGQAECTDTSDDNSDDAT